MVATTLEQVAAAASAAGMALRGAIHPVAEDRVPAMPDGSPAGTLVLAGFVGRGQWPVFAASAEAADGRADPLDRWSRRVVGGLAAELGAMALYPFGGPPWLPFQRWARKVEPVHSSPLGVLIHPDWGLWHSYRGALVFTDHLGLPERPERPSPCDTCAEKPCLSACPVGAFTHEGYDVGICVSHLKSTAGRDCMERGCRSREACPVGAEHRLEPEHASFHMRAFLTSRVASDV